ncbi:MAG: hypothetical protein ACOC7J_00765, partial [Armatimonadota bacterium]
ALDLSRRPLPDEGVTVAIRNDLALRLTLRALPAGATMTCEGGWATVVEQDEAVVVLSVEPSEETRSFTLAW